MAETMRTGRCLCGSVRFAAEPRRAHIAACHCGMCRRWASGPFMAVHCRNVRFESDRHVRRFRSSDWAERGFFDRCGSTLFYHMVGSDQYGVAAGLFDDLSGLQFALQLYIDHKPDFYAFAQQTRTLTEADIVARNPGSK